MCFAKLSLYKFTMFSVKYFIKQNHKKWEQHWLNVFSEHYDKIKMYYNASQVQNDKKFSRILQPLTCT